MVFKINTINNAENFCKALDKCVGKVELITDEGDMLNLKSKLSQLITLNVILNGISKLKDITLKIEKQEDAALLLDYVVGESKAA